MQIEALAVTVAKLEAKAGDSIVISCDKPLTSEQVSRIRGMAEAVLPEGVKALVLCAGLALAGVVPAPGGGGSKV